MLAKVTDLETGEVDLYELSRSNWQSAWACMSCGAVVCWWPRTSNNPLRSDGRPRNIAKSNGYRWQVIGR